MPKVLTNFNVPGTFEVEGDRLKAAKATGRGYLSKEKARLIETRREVVTAIENQKI